MWRAEAVAVSQELSTWDLVLRVKTLPPAFCSLLCGTTFCVPTALLVDI